MSIQKNLILGIDQSFTATGIVILNQKGKLILSKAIKTKPNAPYENRIIDIVEEIINILKTYNIEYVFLEGLAYEFNHPASRPLAGLYYAIVIELIKNGLFYKDVPPSTLKLFATGNGKAKKQKIFECLPEDIKEEFYKTGCKKTTGLHDLADAYFLAKYGLERELIKFQQ